MNVLEFTSKRKRMSVVVQDEDGQILVLSKGADRSGSQIVSVSQKLKQNLSLVLIYAVLFYTLSPPRIITLSKIYSIMFERLSKNGRMYEEATTRHLNEYGENGLRTLALCYKKLEEAEYSAWNNEFQKAKTSIGADREAMLEKVADMLEKEFILVGATAVEDKLQTGVGNTLI